MWIEYRRFDKTLADARAVLAVEAACWNQSPHGPEEALEILRRAGSVCWLAAADGRVVGFVHCFPTVGLGAKIWEVDLLAVHPAYRRRGIGTELVRRAVASAPEDAALCRAFVAVNNVASAKAFAHAGFERGRAVYEIFVRSVRPTDVTLEGEAIAPETVSEGTWVAHCRGERVVYKEVHTLLYRGVWMEGVGRRTPKELIEVGLALAARRGLDEVGPVIAQSDRAARRRIRRMGFGSLGEYNAHTLKGRSE